MPSADLDARRPAPVPAAVEMCERHELRDGWEAAVAPAGHVPVDLGALDWLPAQVPGTAAGALRDAGRWRHGDPRDFDAEEWWFRARFDAPPAEPDEQVLLELDGIATVAEVFLNGERVLESDSMFATHALDVGALLRDGAENELTIRCHALAPLLAERRKSRARWRTRIVADGNLRCFRTSVLGRAPGFAPGPAPVGPWRPLRLRRSRCIAVDAIALRPRLVGDAGELHVSVDLRALGDVAVDAVAAELTGPSGTHRIALTVEPAVAAEPASGAGDAVRAHGVLRVPAVACWWPHTHGDPVLHDVRLLVSAGGETCVHEAGRVGFRALAAGARPDHDVEVDGLDLHVNGVRVFARGAVWSPVDPVGFAADPGALRTALETARDGGMNLLRVPGIGVYESPAFHDLCDELGLLVWQDCMFANFDYPIADERFRAQVEREVTQLLDRLASRPSFAVLCGNSEVEQQVAMLGLDPALGRGELFGELLPGLLDAAGSDAVWVPSAPCGGELPFRTDRGIANYYGVGGYCRPLEDARRAEVRFAAECLAFSNVPDEAGVAAVLPNAPASVVVHHPAWKAGVPRDNGSGWDFEDVRDHYLALLFGVDAAELRRVDHDRYLECSRAVTGEAMAEVFGEWRRAGSRCGGGLVLWLHDLAPGAGWGLVDHAGTPKVAYHHVRRALAPVAVWSTDEGLGGIAVHAANDSPAPLSARLRVALYRDGEQRVGQAVAEVELPAHGARTWNVETLLGHFVDAAYAYRFGPPGHDLVVATLETDDAPADVLSQCFRFPAGRPLAQEPAERLGLAGELHAQPDGCVRLMLRSRRFAYGVRVHAPGFDAREDALSIEPGGSRTIELRPRAAAEPGDVALSALNLRGRVRATRA